jgi:uncharacterized RDD family membrane protein YckC
VFCPSCGVKNDGTGIRCFICRKTLPPLEAPVDRAPRRTRFVHVVSNAASAAAVGDRMLALLFDRCLLVAVLLAAAASQEREISRFRSMYTAGSALFVAIAIAVAITFLYHVLLESTFGATLGKAILGLTVRNESERNRVTAALIRNVMRLVDALPLYGVGFFVALYSPRKQRLGDYSAGTVVLEQRIHWGARTMFLVLWAAIVAGCVWLAWSFCPTCLRF